MPRAIDLAYVKPQAPYLIVPYGNRVEHDTDGNVNDEAKDYLLDHECATKSEWGRDPTPSFFRRNNQTINSVSRKAMHEQQENPPYHR